MPTTAQIEANRKNATRSTGPKTDEGKARSRLNATTHGMTGVQPPVDEPSRAKFAARKAEWADNYPIRSPEEGHAYDLFIASSLQVDRIGLVSENHRVARGHRARWHWEIDRQDAAEAIAEGLSTRPGRTVTRLLGTRQGCELLIHYWERLLEVLADGDWDEAERSRALDLLRLPVDLRRGRTPIDPPEGTDPIDHRRALAVDQLNRLDAILEESLTLLDEFERSTAVATLDVELSADGRLLHRYDREAMNRFHRNRRDLRDGVHALGSTPDPFSAKAPAPEPARAPAPEPEPAPALEPEPLAVAFGLEPATGDPTAGKAISEADEVALFRRDVGKVGLLCRGFRLEMTAAEAVAFAQLARRDGLFDVDPDLDLVAKALCSSGPDGRPSIDLAHLSSDMIAVERACREADSPIAPHTAIPTAISFRLRGFFEETDDQETASSSVVDPADTDTLAETNPISG